MSDGDVRMVFFFFQAEDGIRDWSVTGVQTCALPISSGWKSTRRCSRSCGRREEGSAMVIDEGKLREFVGKAVGDMGAAMGAALVVIGDKLGLYKAMAGAGPLTSTELAKRTACAERYVREWLNAQAAGGYGTYAAAAKAYRRPPAHAFCRADESSPTLRPRGLRVTGAAVEH